VRITLLTLFLFFLAGNWAPQSAERLHKGVGISSYAAAAEDRHPAIETEIVTRFINWIISKTGWAERNSPKISFASPAQLNELYFGKSSGSNGITIKALYERRSQAIHLSSTWNPSNLRDRSYLVHELVHHLQFLNHVEVACANALDIEAYQLQFDWLCEKGIRDPQAFLGISDLVLFSLAQCPLYRACEFRPEGCQK
jgi:hypothetical protein